MAVILGIDPGTLKFGYGVISTDGKNHKYIASGCIHLKGELNDRLGELFQQISTIFLNFRPDRLAIEDVFVHINIRSAIKLGEARGVVIAVAASNFCDVFEYTARQAKKAVVGFGAAAKEQVQYMMRAILKIPKALEEDEADALALALYDANMFGMNKLLEKTR